MKEAAYKGMVRPILEYGSSVWDPHPDKLQKELEKVQNRAARFVTRNYVYETGSMTGILGQLKWESLKKRRKDDCVSKFTSLIFLGQSLVRYCHFGVSPVNYSDSDNSFPSVWRGLTEHRRPDGNIPSMRVKATTFGWFMVPLGTFFYSFIGPGIPVVHPIFSPQSQPSIWCILIYTKKMVVAIRPVPDE